MRVELLLAPLALSCGSVFAACPVLDKFKPDTYRPLPVLSADKPGGLLSLDIHLRRSGTVSIGSYSVTDVPVFVIRPAGGTRAAVRDPETGKSADLPAECLADPRWIFGGTRWSLVQGEQLRVTLTSDLDYDQKSGEAIVLPENGSVPCRATNLHTHGFLVPPTQPASPTGMYGDFPLDVTEPAGSPASDKDTCGDPIMAHAGHRVLSTPIHYGITIPGKPHENGLASGQHPSGLFWYHPHPHGFARMQTGGGTTGLITIGDLGDYACKEETRGKACPAASVPTAVRYLELKDAQLVNKPMNGVYRLLADYTSGACGPRQSGETRRGQCVFDDKSGIWVFTINGVEYPVMQDTRPDVEEVWRIANTSANFSYALELLDAASRVAVKPFRLLAVDGVSVAAGAAAGESNRLLLMPGSRAEVWVTPAPGKTYVLHTAEISTGNNGSGDNWPDIDLAEVRWPEQMVIDRGGGLAGPAVHVSGPKDAPLPVSAAVDFLRGQKKGAAPGIAPACRFDPGDERRIYMVKRNDPREIFGLVAGIKRANGTLEFFDAGGQVAARSLAEAWKKVGGAPPPSPAFGSNDLANICTKQGRAETWVVENWTGETHNFHIHQSRFRLDSDQRHLGNTAYFSYPTVATGNAAVDLMDRLIRDMTQAGPAMATWRDAYHDSVPVPRGESRCAAGAAPQQCQPLKPEDRECQGDPGGALCNPGRVSLAVSFQRAEQVGRFIYHCHILEHEDGGMMGEITVGR